MTAPDHAPMHFADEARPGRRHLLGPTVALGVALATALAGDAAGQQLPAAANTPQQPGLGTTPTAAPTLDPGRLSDGAPDGGPGPTGLPGLLPHPVLFVTQVPVPADFLTIGSTFGNHRGSANAAHRGGDLWIRDTDGTLRNLTAAAGYGSEGFQGVDAIAVRDPDVHWDGDKAVFSMAIGAPARQFELIDPHWQLYEITGLGPQQTPVITKLPHQPEGFDNVDPIYLPDDRILFASDRPITGQAHHHPQLDEYEEKVTVTGFWSLDPATGDVHPVTHAPSGDFAPLVDSAGRVVFTRWDHLQRDQQADADNGVAGTIHGTFNWSSEAVDAVALATNAEIFPEPRPGSPSLVPGGPINGHRFNHFTPWMMAVDGTGLETLNHVGRHELHDYFDRSRNDDPNLDEFIQVVSEQPHDQTVENLLMLCEDPTTPGRFVAVSCPEFETHASGQLVAIQLAPTDNPDGLSIESVTHPVTGTSSATPGPEHSGHYRDPLVTSDGRVLAAHTFATTDEVDLSGGGVVDALYDFRLRLLKPEGEVFTAGQPLTPGIVESVSWYTPDVLLTYAGPLWELDPVEVVARPRPTPWTPHGVAAPEQAAFASAGVDVAAFRQWLWEQDLALLISRDVTTRDAADKQQPFNLRVANGTAQTVAEAGTLYDVEWLQLFQGDLVRGVGGPANPSPGRRVLAQPLHDAPGFALSDDPAAPPGSVALGADGSLAALVPTRRALSWQLSAPDGEAVVRERYWLSFQPGEIVTCISCHGLNTADQVGGTGPTNTPQALIDLLADWQAQLPPVDPGLGATADGSVGAGGGGPQVVLRVDGSAGGPAHRVDVAAGQPFTLSVDQPTSHRGAARFALFGYLGVPGAGAAYDTAAGTLAFPPPFAAPAGLGGSFTLANGLGPQGDALFPAGPAPWSLTLPGVAAPFELTLQGVIEDGADPERPLSTTNAVLVRVVP